MTEEEVNAAFDELVESEVRVVGRLKKAEGVSTQIDCPPGICCSQQLDPGLTLRASRQRPRMTLGELHLTAMRLLVINYGFATPP